MKSSANFNRSYYNINDPDIRKLQDFISNKNNAKLQNNVTETKTQINNNKQSENNPKKI